MIKFLTLSFLLATTAASALLHPPPHARRGLIEIGLTDDPAAAPTPSPSPSPSAADDAATTNAPTGSADKASCNGVSFTRGIKYGDNSDNVLDAATMQTKPDARRPVLVFVAGESFTDDGKPAMTNPLVEQAMCFAATNGLVAFNISYRRAPDATWPAGARDVAAAISWVHENADLFGGNAQEIIPIGYSTGAFHVASFLAHKELQEADSDVAGAVLVSGIYRPAADGGDGERRYFGADASKYDSRSAIPGLTEIEIPLVVAWSQADAPRFIAQGEKLKQVLCNAGHCPRTALLTKPDSPASVFDLDGASAVLHERLRQLIGQIDARGLP